MCRRGRLGRSSRDLYRRSGPRRPGRSGDFGELARDLRHRVPRRFRDVAELGNGAGRSVSRPGRASEAGERSKRGAGGSARGGTPRARPVGRSAASRPGCHGLSWRPMRINTYRKGRSSAVPPWSRGPPGGGSPPRRRAYRRGVAPGGGPGASGPRNGTTRPYRSRQRDDRASSIQRWTSSHSCGYPTKTGTWSTRTANAGSTPPTDTAPPPNGPVRKTVPEPDPSTSATLNERTASSSSPQTIDRCRGWGRSRRRHRRFVNSPRPVGEGQWCRTSSPGRASSGRSPCGASERGRIATVGERDDGYLASRQDEPPSAPPGPPRTIPDEHPT